MFDFKKMLYSQMGTIETEPQLVSLANSLRGLSCFAGMTDDEFDNILLSASSTLRESFGESYVIESKKKHESWFDNYYKNLGATRWDRYVDYLQNQKGFAPAVITGMQENLFKIIDLAGNPNGDNFKNKGLIVGDVQSGKTANYVGLMNLATDAQYKIIIVLTGTTNTLREQTQIRIEEGLGKANLQRGVSCILNEDYQSFAYRNPIYLTSQDNDFKTSSKKNFQLSIETTVVPIVIVTKKNVTALSNIYEWLTTYSKRNKNDNYINSSLLLIDDEADYASVNTKSEDENPTVINRKIREILELFTKSSYVGFTATPFANIFINPDSNEEMFGQDLFPQDYIYVLGESNEYLGVQNIFGINAEHSNMVEKINIEVEERYFKLKHKKDDPFIALSPTLKDAINLFFIANVVRDLRGDLTKHRSMLINISRFTAMHGRIKNVTLEYIDKMKREIRLYSKLPIEEAIESNLIESLERCFKKYYSNLTDRYSFKDILKNLNDAVYRIKVEIVNKDNKELDYIKNEEDGERVIVIGGFSLSRGLTLEGLMISYYYRNSVMYDSLLQMGRWFGYRPKYADLCKIFMTDDAASDFSFIASATEELKDDLSMNSRRGLTPREFGIKVRSGQTGLIITARNKMRAGKKITASIDFNNAIIETTALTISGNGVNDKNINVIKNIVDENKSKITRSCDPSSNSQTIGLADVSLLEIIEFLHQYIPSVGSKFDSELVVKWLKTNASPKFDKWDIVFITGSSDREFDYGNGVTGRCSVRTMIRSDLDNVLKSANSRLGSPNDGRFGLSSPQYEKVLQKYGGKNGEKNATIAQKKYFEMEFEHKPVLLIYSVLPRVENENSVFENYVPMISVGIPEISQVQSKPVVYTVNSIYQDLAELEGDEE